jgi:hypothetical protein
MPFTHPARYLESAFGNGVIHGFFRPAVSLDHGVFMFLEIEIMIPAADHMEIADPPVPLQSKTVRIVVFQMPQQGSKQHGFSAVRRADDSDFLLSIPVKHYPKLLFQNSDSRSVIMRLIQVSVIRQESVRRQPPGTVLLNEGTDPAGWFP